MDQRFYFSLIIAAIVLCLCVLPVSAVIQEVTLKGTVSALSQKDNTLTLENPARYGCDYPAGGSPVCSYTPINTPLVTGTVPTGSVFSVFKTGDTAVATSLGGTGGTWMTISKLYGSRPNEEYVTDIVGDPGTVLTPIVGGYALDIATTPDCTTCYETTCTATTADVRVKSSSTVVAHKTLSPRQSLSYNGRNDGSSIAVTFVKGEALSETCAGGGYGMTGPQTVSVFVVNVVPPIGFAPQDIPAATITANPVQETVPTTKAASLPFAAIGALGMIVLVLAARRQ